MSIDKDEKYRMVQNQIDLNTSISISQMVSSGRIPRDSGPHSFNSNWQKLSIMPLLTTDDLNTRSSTLKAATF